MSVSLLKNSSAVFASRILNGAASLGITLIIVRVVEMAAFGRFAFAIATGTLAAVLSEAGTGLALVREVSRDRGAAGRSFGTLLSLRIIAATVVMGAGAGLAFALTDRETALGIGLGLFIGLTRSLSRHVTSLFYGFERMELETGLLLLESILSVGAALIGAAAGFDLLELMGLLALAYFLGLLFRLGGARSLLRDSPLRLWDPEILRLAWQQAAEYGLFALAAMVYSQADIPLVTFALGEANTGLYQAAAKILVFLMLLPEGLGNALLPAVSRGDDPAKTNALAGEAASYLAAVGLPIALGGWLLADPMMTLLYGHDYVAAGSLFALLLLSVPLRFHSTLEGTLLTAYGLQKKRARVMIFASVFLLAAVLVGATFGGLEGVALARVAVELFLLLGYAIALGRTATRAVAPARLLRMLPALALMGLCVFYVRAFPVWAVIGVGALVYGAAGLALGVVPYSLLARIGNKA